MANTEDIEAKLAAYVDGELDPADRAQIEAHLASNPQHAALIDDLLKTRSMMRALPRSTSPVDISETLSAQLERASLLGDVDIGVDDDSMRINPWWRRIGSVAAVFLVTASLAAALYYALPSPKERQPQITIVTPDISRTLPAPGAAPLEADSKLAATIAEPSTTVADKTLEDRKAEPSHVEPGIAPNASMTVAATQPDNGGAMGGGLAMNAAPAPIASAPAVPNPEAQTVGDLALSAKAKSTFASTNAPSDQQVNQDRAMANTLLAMNTNGDESERRDPAIQAESLKDRDAILSRNEAAYYIVARADNAVAAASVATDFLSSNQIAFDRMSKTSPTTPPTSAPTTEPSGGRIADSAMATSATSNVGGPLYPYRQRGYGRADGRAANSPRASTSQPKDIAEIDPTAPIVVRGLTRAQFDELNGRLGAVAEPARELVALSDAPRSGGFGGAGPSTSPTSPTSPIREQIVTQTSPLQSAGQQVVGQGQFPGQQQASIAKAAQKIQATTLPDQSQPIAPGDTLRVRAQDIALGVEAIDELIAVDANGKLDLPRVGQIAVVGLPPREAASALPHVLSDDPMKAELGWTIERVTAPVVPPPVPAVASPATGPSAGFRASTQPAVEPRFDVVVMFREVIPVTQPSSKPTTSPGDR